MTLEPSSPILDGLDFERGPVVDAGAGITEEERRVLDELAAALEGLEQPA